MDKICIVKRRRRDLFPVPDITGESGEGDFAVSMPMPTGPKGVGPRGSAGVISAELTPEQFRELQSRGGLTPGKAFVVNLENSKPESGQVVFTFRLTPLYGGRMLSPGDVCAMLRISRSSLAKLVRTGKIDSYRIGRLRRFLLEDILSYLSHNREFSGKEL